MPGDDRGCQVTHGCVQFAEPWGIAVEQRLRAAVSRAGHTAAPEVAVFGEWDTENLGDRAIQRGVERFFADCGWRVSAYGLGSLAPVAENVPARAFLPAARSARDVLHRLAPRAGQVLRAARQRARMLQLLPRLRRAHAISVGGGALLSDAGLHFPQSLAVLAECARLLDKSVLCLGCSAEGPWSAMGERRIARFLATCTGIAARDDATASRVSGVLRRPLPVFGDFCLTETHVRSGMRWSGQRCGIGVNVSRIAEPWSMEQERYEDAIAAVAGHVARANAGRDPRVIRIFTTGLPADEAPAQRVLRRLAGNPVELHFPRDLGQLTAVLRACSLVVASRLHGAILALAEGAPVIGFSPAPKLANFLTTMGIGQHSFGLDDTGRLAAWLSVVQHESILEEQRDRLQRAPVWFARERVRTALQAVAGAPAVRRSGATCT